MSTLPPRTKIDANPHTNLQIPKGVARSRAYMLKHNVRDFPHWTSTHALPLTRRSASCLCVIFWLIVAAAATAITAWQVAIAIIQYFQYDVATVNEYTFRERIFPAVTACDANPYKKSIALQNQQVTELMDTYVYAVKKLACSSSPSCKFIANATLDTLMQNYSLSGINDSVSLQTKSKRLLVLVAAANEVAMAPARAKMSEFLQGCSFNTQDCYSGDWTEWRDPTMGNCYTFNKYANRTVNRAGPIYGLRVIFKTNVSEYIQTSSNVGMVFQVHDQDEYPFPDTFGVYIEPNTATELGMEYKQISRLGNPYGNCEDTKPTNYLYNLSYSTEGCQRSAYQQEVVTTCGCYDPTYPAPINSSAPMCNVPGDVGCWSKIIDNSAASNGSCLEPCFEGVYEIARSAARWPSGSLSTIGECEEGDYYNTTCLQMYTENGAFIEVYFENLSYQSLNETAALTIPTLLSNIGGQIGLWLGMYIISVVEVVLLGGQLFLSCLYPPMSKPVAY